MIKNREIDKAIYRLRPHHGMCLAFFEGKGYSEGFTAHMQKMKEVLEKEAVVKLIVTGDEICSACPNLKDGICETEEKVEKYDREVLRLCGLEEGNVLKFAEFSSRVWKNILHPGKRVEICGDCQWNEICSRLLP